MSLFSRNSQASLTTSWWFTNTNIIIWHATKYHKTLTPLTSEKDYIKDMTMINDYFRSSMCVCVPVLVE